MRKHPYPTRQLVNETAANVTKLLVMMRGMPDKQVEYLFNNSDAFHMKAASEDMVRKGQDMIDRMGDWYPGSEEQAEGRLRRTYTPDPCKDCNRGPSGCHVCEHGGP
jgi:hypothetical protein